MNCPHPHHRAVGGKTADGTAYELCGDIGLPVLVLIHGLGLNRHLWRAYETALLPHYRVLKYDLCGHGDSAPPRTFSLAGFAAQLHTLLDELRIKACALVGFSLGGMINRRFAMDFPARVTALAIFNSPHERSAEAQRLIEARAAQSETHGIAAALDSTMARWFNAEFQTAHPETIAQIRRWLSANEPAVYAQCRHVLVDGVLELIDPQPPIACPTLVMTCEHDHGSTPRMARAIAAEIDGAQTRIVPGLRHLGLVEQPTPFITALLQFLQSAIQ